MQCCPSCSPLPRPTGCSPITRNTCPAQPRLSRQQQQSRSGSRSCWSGLHSLRLLAWPSTISEACLPPRLLCCCHTRRMTGSRSEQRWRRRSSGSQSPCRPSSRSMDCSSSSSSSSSSKHRRSSPPPLSPCPRLHRCKTRRHQRPPSRLASEWTRQRRRMSLPPRCELQCPILRPWPPLSSQRRRNPSRATSSSSSRRSGASGTVTSVSSSSSSHRGSGWSGSGQ